MNDKSTNLTGVSNYATVVREGFEVPLIGIPKEAILEICDCCGEIIGLSKSVFSGSQILCEKCNK